MRIIDDAALRKNCPPLGVFLDAYFLQEIEHPEVRARVAYQSYQVTDKAPDCVVDFCLDVLTSKGVIAT